MNRKGWKFLHFSVSLCTLTHRHHVSKLIRADFYFSHAPVLSFIMLSLNMISLTVGSHFDSDREWEYAHLQFVKGSNPLKQITLEENEAD